MLKFIYNVGTGLSAGMLMFAIVQFVLSPFAIPVRCTMFTATIFGLIVSAIVAILMDRHDSDADLGG